VLTACPFLADELLSEVIVNSAFAVFENIAFMFANLYVFVLSKVAAKNSTQPLTTCG
jgi:hypothetical protein